MTGSETVDTDAAVNFPEEIIGDPADNEVIISESVAIYITKHSAVIPKDGEESLKERHAKWWKEHGDKCNGSISLINMCIRQKKFDYKEIAGALADIFGVGSAVKAFLKLIPDAKPTEPALILLNSLKQQIEVLSDQMNARFDGLEAFLTELNFQENIGHPLGSLRRFMTDCLEHPSENALQHFKSFYNDHFPLKVAYHLMDTLENDATNPLKKAMKADPLKTTYTFERWYNIIDGLLGECLVLEAYASGLLKEKDSYDAERLMERAEPLYKKMDEWKIEYLTNGSYWNGMPAFLKRYQQEHTHLSLKRKADELRDALNTIMTRDAFYLIVYKERNSNKDFGIHTYQPENLIESNNVGGCCVVLYRSRQVYYMRDNQLNLMKNAVKKCHRNTIQSLNDYSDYPRTHHSKLLGAQGLLCFIRRLDEEIRSANCPRLEWGPGWYDSCATYLASFFNVRCHDITMIAAYW